MAMRAIKTVIFDCGRVITYDQKKNIADQMAAIIGAPAEEFPAAYATDRGEYDRGTMNALVYWNKVASRFGSKVDESALPELIRLDQDSWFNINPETVDIIMRLKERGRRLLILSNMNEEGKECMLGRARSSGGKDWIAPFDEILLSCDLKLMKPEPEIYRACLKLADASPEECVFIDDTVANVEAARALGMHAIHFTGSARRLASILADEYKAL
ncbi:MAG TPA: HAD family phosphatase [Rectinemataceae bacterium]|nr:HAD family phosphatase [Rectinemataceae bacterium]